MATGPAARGLFCSLVVFALLTSCGSGQLSRSDRSPTQVAAAGSGPDRPLLADGVGAVPPGTPCPGAALRSAGQVVADSGPAVYLPKDGLERVTAAWTCGADTPVLMLDDGQLSFESRWSNVDIDEKLADLADDYGGSVRTIQGHRAWVAPATAPGTYSGVLMVQGDTAIRLLAVDGVPVERLTAIAAELDLGVPAG